MGGAQQLPPRASHEGCSQRGGRRSTYKRVASHSRNRNARGPAPGIKLRHSCAVGWIRSHRQEKGNEFRCSTQALSGVCAALQSGLDTNSKRGGRQGERREGARRWGARGRRAPSVTPSFRDPSLRAARHSAAQQSGRLVQKPQAERPMPFSRGRLYKPETAAPAPPRLGRREKEGENEFRLPRRPRMPLAIRAPPGVPPSWPVPSGASYGEGRARASIPRQQ